MEFVLLAIVILYLVPYTVAASREHPRRNWILWLNLLLGWAGIGWVLSLAWSLSAPDGRVARRWPWVHPQKPSRRSRAHLRVLPGGSSDDAWAPKRASDSHE